eukprot:1145976-Rhodomonas_salina.1
MITVTAGGQWPVTVPPGPSCQLRPPAGLRLGVTVSLRLRVGVRSSRWLGLDTPPRSSSSGCLVAVTARSGTRPGIPRLRLLGSESAGDSSLRTRSPSLSPGPGVQTPSQA